MRAICVHLCVIEQVWHHLHQRCIKWTKLLHRMPHLGGFFSLSQMEMDWMSEMQRRNPSGYLTWWFFSLSHADKLHFDLFEHTRCMSHFYDWETARGKSKPLIFESYRVDILFFPKWTSLHDNVKRGDLIWIRHIRWGSHYECEVNRVTFEERDETVWITFHFPYIEYHWYICAMKYNILHLVHAVDSNVMLHKSKQYGKIDTLKMWQEPIKL